MTVFIHERARSAFTRNASNYKNNSLMTAIALVLLLLGTDYSLAHASEGIIADNQEVNEENLEITTNGNNEYGGMATNSGKLTLEDSTINTKGSRAYGLYAVGNSSIVANNVDIVTENDSHAYGVYAVASGLNTPTVSLMGGSVTTASTKGQGTQNGDGSRGYAIYSDGKGTQVDATGTAIHTFGQRAYGAFAVNGSEVNLKDLSLKTEGFMAYGVYLWDADTQVTLSNVDVTTYGQVGDAVTALDGSRVEIDGGTFTVHGEPNPSSSGELASGLLSAGEVNARNVTVVTYGTNSRGLRAGLNVAPAPREGIITLTDSSVTVNGENALAAEVAYGGSISTNRTTLTSAKGVGIALWGNGSINLNDTIISSEKETILSTFRGSGESQTIIIRGHSVATKNNGTLLIVKRNADGADGVLNLTLGAGSTTSGDIIDLDAKTSGWTDVTLEAGAHWVGKLFGVRNFFGQKKGNFDFNDYTEIGGSLEGNGTIFNFSQQGASIGGDMNLVNGSQTKGGSLTNPIVVKSDVTVDSTSKMGGNWSIGGNLKSGGLLSPGNSLGRINIDNDLELQDTSVYGVEVDLSGDADLITVGNTAYLNGKVVVSAIDDFKLASPYTIIKANSINGEFKSASLTGSRAFLDAYLAYGTDNVTVTIDRNSTSFASVAETSNQAAVADALDLTSINYPITNKIVRLSAKKARDAFQKLAGDFNASVKTGLIETANMMADLINNRVRSVFEGIGAKQVPTLSLAQTRESEAASAIDGVSKTRSSTNNGFWASGFGSWIDQDGNANTGGMKTSTGGFLSGMDVSLSSGWRVGFVGGYSQTDMDSKGRYASAKSDNWHLGSYGGKQWGALGLRAGLIHTWHSLDASRSVTYADIHENLRSNYDARSLQSFAEVGYQIDLAPASFEPFANLSHVRLRTDGYREKGGDAGLNLTSQMTHTTFTTLGIRTAVPFTLGSLSSLFKGTLGWRHAYGDTTPVATQAFSNSKSFTVQGVPVVKDVALFEAGLDFQISQATTFGISYVGQYGSRATQNGFKARLNVKL